MSIGGRDTNFQHGSFATPSVIADYTTSIMSLDMPLQADEADATVFGDGFRSYESTFKSGTIGAEYYYTTAMYDILFAIWDGEVAVDFQIGPTGTSGGNVKLTGSMVLVSLGLPMRVGDVIKVPASWRITGAVDTAHFS